MQSKLNCMYITHLYGSADAIQTKLYLYHVFVRLSRCNPDETSNYIAYRNGSANAVQTKLVSNIRYPNGTVYAIQTKLYHIFERLCRFNSDKTSNYITNRNVSADAIQTIPYWNHPSTRCWSIITLGILHIRNNRTPQITHVEVIKAERVFGDVKWDGL
jgi:hypothetical protein